MKDAKRNAASKKNKPKKANPFVQMIEDKKRIDQAIQNGERLSMLRNIPFVKLL